MRGRDKTSRIPVKVIPTEGPLPRKPALDPGPGRRPRSGRGAGQAPVARAGPAQRVRGSVLPESRRVLLARHRDVHDHGRPVYPPVPVLRRRRARAAEASRPGRADPSRRGDSGARPALRGDHLGRSGRPPGRRRRPFRGLRACGAPEESRYPHRSPRPGFPRPDGRGARGADEGSTGRVQPQPRNGAAAVSQGPSRIGLRVVARISSSGSRPSIRGCPPSPG